MLELQYGFTFIDAKTEDIAVDLKGSKILPGASLAICKQHTQVAETILRCSELLEYVQDESVRCFWPNASVGQDSCNF